VGWLGAGDVDEGNSRGWSKHQLWDQMNLG
jgi:hypothetical protein